MKLSQFKGLNIKKRLQFVNGELKETFVGEQIDGDIDFYVLDIEKLEVINNEVVSKLEDSDSTDLMMYKIIPYITNVECDVTFEEFMLMMKSPSKAFMAFAGEIVASINEMFVTIGELSKVIEETSKLTDVTTAPVKESVDAEKKEVKVENIISKDAELDTEVLLDNLYEKLNKTSNREERKKLIKRISDLQKE